MSKELDKALECLEKIIDNLDDYADFEIKQEANEYIDTIKQALLKAQEKEKEKLLFKNIHNTKVKTPLVSIFEGLSKDERFKITEHIYYHWEEMKEALEDKNNELEKENVELKAKAQKEHKALDLLMQELDCKDFAELRKYARCGYEKLNSFNGSKEFKIEIPESSLMNYNPVKQYLKWEDLEFTDEWKHKEVKLNGTKYNLEYKCDFDFFDNYYEVVKLIDKETRKRVFMLRDKKQIFNDLHLERVEE